MSSPEGGKKITCPSCNQSISAWWKACPVCGAGIPAPGAGGRPAGDPGAAMTGGGMTGGGMGGAPVLPAGTHFDPSRGNPGGNPGGTHSGGPRPPQGEQGMDMYPQIQTWQPVSPVQTPYAVMPPGGYEAMPAGPRPQAPPGGFGQPQFGGPPQQQPGYPQNGQYPQPQQQPYPQQQNPYPQQGPGGYPQQGGYPQPQQQPYPQPGQPQGPGGYPQAPQQQHPGLHAPAQNYPQAPQQAPAPQGIGRPGPGGTASGAPAGSLFAGLLPGGTASGQQAPAGGIPRSTAPGGAPRAPGAGGTASGTTGTSLADLLQGMPRTGGTSIPSGGAGGTATGNRASNPPRPAGGGEASSSNEDALLTMLRTGSTASASNVPESHKAQLQNATRKSQPPAPRPAQPAAGGDKLNLSLMELLQAGAGASTPPVTPPQPEAAAAGARAKPDPTAVLPVERERTKTTSDDRGMEISSLSPLSEADEPSVGQDKPKPPMFDSSPPTGNKSGGKNEPPASSSFASLRLSNWKGSAKPGESQESKAPEARSAELPPSARPTEDKARPASSQDEAKRTNPAFQFGKKPDKTDKNEKPGEGKNESVLDETGPRSRPGLPPPTRSDDSSLIQRRKLWSGVERNLDEEDGSSLLQPDRGQTGKTMMIMLFLLLIGSGGAALVITGVVPLPVAMQSGTGTQAQGTSAVDPNAKTDARAQEFLAILLDGNDSGPQVRAVALLAEMGAPGVTPLREALRKGSPRVQRLVAESIGKMGPAAKDAIPELAETARSGSDPQIRKAAAEALGLMGKAALPEVERLVTQPDAAPQRYGAAAAATLGADAAPLAPYLVKILGDSTAEKDAKEDAGRALGLCGEKVVPDLGQLVISGDRDTKYYAAVALGKLGPAAIDAVEPLCSLLSARERSLIDQAAMALKGIGPNAAPALLRNLRAPGQTFTESRKILKSFGSEIVSALIEALGSNEADVRMGSASLLSDLGGAAREALPMLEKLEQEDKDDTVRQYARLAIQQIRR